ncbi:AI-2E family transporter [Aegicerativicinus sediminis]|uniref:AI-2E family transporter n=1 Tax=Aegicerativicinus sediminis TaxID=2893202 RepID=UPI001E355157|nr:AI-2E family transporter [Aegicerativicinus sediminis]
MDSKTIAKGILTAIFTLAGITILLYFIYEIRSVIGYLVIAGVLSLIGRPLVYFLRRKLRFNKLLAVIITIVLLLGIFLGIISLFVPLIVDQGHNLALLDIEKLEANVEQIYLQIMDFLNVNHELAHSNFNQTNFLQNLDYGMIPEFLNNFISGLGSFGIGLFSVLFITFFFLKDAWVMEDGILMFVPDHNVLKVRKSMTMIKDLLSRYFVGLLLQLTILFVIYTIVLLVVGIENAVVIAFLCAVINIIPYLGPLISAILMVLLTMSSNLQFDFTSVILPKTIYVMIGFTIGQLVDNFFSQPYIFSKSVKSHPLEIFLVIIIAGLVFGIIGMIAAVPAYTVIKVIAKEFLPQNKLVRTLTRGLN